MELYHASTVSIEHPIILNRHNCLDFGTGFYTTANRIQAEDFARRVYYRRGQEGSARKCGVREPSEALGEQAAGPSPRIVGCLG